MQDLQDDGRSVNIGAGFVQGVARKKFRYTTGELRGDRDSRLHTPENGAVAIAFRQPAPSAAAWEKHAVEVRMCQGEVCLSALKGMFHTDSLRRLELLVDGRGAYRPGEDRSVSNKFRTWKKGTLPSRETVKRASAKSGSDPALTFWRYHPLWDLLTREPRDIEWLNEQLEQSPPKIREVLFFRRRPDRSGRYLHTPPTREQALIIRDMHSLEALVAHLCLARKAELAANDLMHFLSAAAAYDMLPWVLLQNPILEQQRAVLIRCLKRVFWIRQYAEDTAWKLPIKKIESRLATLKRDPNAQLPQTLGILPPTARHWPVES